MFPSADIDDVSTQMGRLGLLKSTAFHSFDNENGLRLDEHAMLQEHASRLKHLESDGLHAVIMSQLHIANEYLAYNQATLG